MERLFRFLTKVPVGPIIGVVAIGGIWLMSGTPAAAHRVPDLEGLQVNAAIAQAADEGYFARVVERSAGGIAGTVVRQDPPARAIRDKGTELVLVMTRGAPQVRVPAVTGLVVEEARRRIDRVHLDPGVVTYRKDDKQQPNHVITTVPAPGKLVDVGTTVEIIAAD